MGTIKLVMVAASVALAGCASPPPLAAGGKNEVQFAAGETIRIAWNPTLTNEEAMRSIVRAHCGGRNFDEVAATEGTQASGPVVTKTWRCHHFPGGGAR